MKASGYVTKEEGVVMDFMNHVMAQAKRIRKTIVLPESTDIRILQAVDRIRMLDLADIILIGNEKEIYQAAGALDISHAIIVDPSRSGNLPDYAETFHEMRKSKGIRRDQALAIMEDPFYYATMMVKKGDADGMVGGANCSTANALRPALQIVRTAPGVSLISGFFIMVVPDCRYGQEGIFVYADAGLVENPSAEELAEIAISSAKSFHTFVQAEPKVAMLSYSTYGSAESALTEKVIEATRLAKKMAPHLMIDGELQVDAAIIPGIGRMKAPGSSVAGGANVLVFPDLNSGNIAYKITERLARARAYGLVTQGFAKPVNDLSRGCTADDVVGVIALTCVQAQSPD